MIFSMRRGGGIWVTLRQAFPQRGGLFNQTGIMPRLRAVQGRFQKATIAHAMGTAIALNLFKRSEIIF